MLPLPEPDGGLLEPEEPLDGALVLPLSEPAPPPGAPDDDGVLLEVPLPLSVAAGPLEDGVPLELPLLLSEPEEPLDDGMLPELPLLLSEPGEPLDDGALVLPLPLSEPAPPPGAPDDDGVLLGVPLPLSVAAAPLDDGMPLELPELDMPLPEEPLLSMLLPSAALPEDFCFELWDLSFFLLVLCFGCVPDSEVPAALLPALLPADFSFSCCIRSSSACCSTAAALAGSVVLEIPLSELCAKLTLAMPNVASKVTNLSFFIIISVGCKTERHSDRRVEMSRMRRNQTGCRRVGFVNDVKRTQVQPRFITHIKFTIATSNFYWIACSKPPF